MFSSLSLLSCPETGEVVEIRECMNTGFVQKFLNIILEVPNEQDEGYMSDSQSVSEAVDRLISKSQEFRPNKTLLRDHHPFLI